MSTALWVCDGIRHAIIRPQSLDRSRDAINNFMKELEVEAEVGRAKGIL